MQYISAYYAAIVVVTLLIIWILSLLSSTSARAKQWLYITLGLALPISLVSIWLWQWSAPKIGLSQNISWILVLSGLSLYMSIIASWSRRYLDNQFNWPITLSWTRYIATIGALVLVGFIAPSLPWSSSAIFTTLLSCIALSGAIYFANKRIVFTQVVQIVTTAIFLVIIGSAAAYLSPGLGSLLVWRVGFTWSQIGLLLSAMAAWPIVTYWWLNQTVPSTAATLPLSKGKSHAS